jgi:hypothetical protein
MIVAAQALDHIHAHFAKPNESDFHQNVLPFLASSGRSDRAYANSAGKK